MLTPDAVDVLLSEQNPDDAVSALCGALVHGGDRIDLMRQGITDALRRMIHHNPRLIIPVVRVLVEQGDYGENEVGPAWKQRSVMQSASWFRAEFWRDIVHGPRLRDIQVHLLTLFTDDGARAMRCSPSSEHVQRASYRTLKCLGFEPWMGQWLLDHIAQIRCLYTRELALLFLQSCPQEDDAIVRALMGQASDKVLSLMDRVENLLAYSRRFASSENVLVIPDALVLGLARATELMCLTAHERRTSVFLSLLRLLRFKPLDLSFLEHTSAYAAQKLIEALNAAWTGSFGEMMRWNCVDTMRLLVCAGTKGLRHLAALYRELTATGRKKYRKIVDSQIRLVNFADLVPLISDPDRRIARIASQWMEKQLAVV